jgi:hypothetical protein
MRRIWISLVAAGLLTIAAIAPAAGQNIFSVPLDSVDDSGVTGGASIRGVDEGVEITVFISAGDEGGVHPVNIYEGTCAELGEVSQELESIEEGQSVTTIDGGLGDIMTGEYAIAVGASEDDPETHVMCGNIPAVEGLAPADDDDAAEEDDEAVEDEDDAVEEDDDAVAEDDDAAMDDEEDADVADDEDMVDEEDDAATEEDDEIDDTEEMVPAAGGAGMNTESAVALMTVLSGAALGTGLLVRRRFSQVRA